MGPAHPSPIGRLVNELLSSILLHVKLNSSPSSFLSCLLCCKTWHSIALPLLYHDLLLTNSNLEAFVKHFNYVLCGSLVRSLTFCIEAVEPELQPNAPHPSTPHLAHRYYLKQHSNQSSKKLWGLLNLVSGKVATMIRLMTFSLYVSPEPWGRRGNILFWLPRPIIAKLIQALPDSCVHLEIDTRGHDYSKPGSGHVCDAIRRMLPQLQNLRLRLGCLCPAIFGAAFDPSDPAMYFSNFQPVAASSLQTVVLNCSSGDGFGPFSNLCGTPQMTLFTKPNPEALLALVDSLRLGMERHIFTAAKGLCVVHVLPRDNDDASIHATVLRHDIQDNQTSALPLRKPMSRSLIDSFAIRTLDGQEFLSYSWAIEALVEGQIWIESKEGYRLPAMLLATGPAIYAAKTLPLKTTQEWRANNPRKSCLLWANEERCKIRLSDAETREGLTDMTPIREKTPAGWHRTFNGSFLERDES